MNHSSNAGQALIETLFVIPACMVCAMVLIDCGVVIRDRVALAQAASQAGVAAQQQGDVDAAARRAVPKSMRGGLTITRDNSSIELRAAASLPIVGSHLHVPLTASVATDSTEGGAS
ncbi:MAG: hypothetical protein H7123_00995 [Thermoleophilia bacterium]|nr:hypothetical protein [Thermoleophilia bacterium]